MQSSTLQKLEQIYADFPDMRADGVPQSEIDAAAAGLGVPFPPDYQEFLRHYGGAHAGSLPIAGLRRWKIAGRSDWNVIELTERHRAEAYPGAERWVIFSDDGFGNPVGFDEAGRIWLSDHNSQEFVCLESSLEDWICRWALQIQPHREDYVARERWPEAVLQKPRNRKA